MPSNEASVKYAQGDEYVPPTVSVVWCDKAPYHVLHSPGEVQHIIARAVADHDPTVRVDPRDMFVWFDLKDPPGTGQSHPEQVMCRIGAISSVVKAPRY